MKTLRETIIELVSEMLPDASSVEQETIVERVLDVRSEDADEVFDDFYTEDLVETIKEVIEESGY